MKVVIHEKPDKRASWASHGVNGWYLGPEMEHYCCYRVYVTNTRAERNSDTVEFFPQNTKVHSIAAIDADTTAAQQLVTALSDPKPNTPLEKVGNRQLAALRILAHIFRHTASLNKPRYEAPNHTAKPRVEASNPRVQKQLPPLQTTTSTHRYPTLSTHAANLTGVIDDTNSQYFIPGNVPRHADDAAPQFTNAIIDNNTGEVIEY